MENNSEKDNSAESYQRDRELFDEIMDQSPIGIAIVDPKGELIDCNEYLGDLLGFTCDELLDLNFGEFTHPDDLKKEWPLIKEMWDGKRKRYSIIKRYFHRDGHIIWVEVVASVIRDKKGQPKLGFAFVQDISAEIEAKRELKKSKEYYQGVVEDQTELIVRWKNEGILTFVNRSYCDFFKKTKQELIGKTFLELIPKEDRHLIEENVEKITEENPISSHEHRVIKPDGSIGWTEWINRGIFDEEGELIEYQSVGRDITNRKKTEQQLRMAKKSSEFYKDLLAHDMRNILNNIKLSMELIERVKEQEDMQEMIKTINKQIERGTSLISNIKSFSILEENQDIIKSVDLINTLQKAIENIETRFKEKDILIELETFQKDLDVKAGDMLLNVFENFLINAVMHNESEVKRVWIEISRIHIRGEDYLKIEFKDNGRGISEERKKTIFNRSYDKNKFSGGMGIGLSLVHRIIEKYDGLIKIENRITEDYTQGSNFIIFLKEA
jgi:PAS domain S-box-containing protein